MQRRFTVIGLGQFGARVAQHLTASGAEVMAIDRDEAVIEHWRSRVDQAVVMDATREASLREIGLEDVDSVIVAVACDLEVSILVTALLVRLGVAHIVSRAASEVHEHILQLIGAHQVVNPEGDMADALGHRLLTPEVRDRVVLPSGHEWLELAVPPELVGHTVAKLRLRERFGLHLLGILRHEAQVAPDGRSTFRHRLVDNPGPEQALDEGDALVLVGGEDGLRRFREA